MKRVCWISVKDKMPREHEWIILGSEILNVTTWGMLINGKFVHPDLDYAVLETISHWMALPNPPGANKKGLKVIYEDG
jgi:hypothetical protein